MFENKQSWYVLVEGKNQNDYEDEIVPSLNAALKRAKKSASPYVRVDKWTGEDFDGDYTATVYEKK